MSTAALGPGQELCPAPDTRADRQWRVEQGIHNWAMEGLQISPETRADAQDYVEGRITVDELVARGRARYGLD